MSQQLIGDSSPSPRVRFVDLPLRVRRRIYWHLDDIAPATVQRHHRLNSGCPWGWGMGSPWQGHAFANLLLTCRTTYNDLIPIVYSQHDVIIDYSRCHSLLPLRLLRPSTLFSLKTLSIHLTDPLFSPQEPDSSKPVLKAPPQPAECLSDFVQLSEIERLTQRIIREWHSTWDQYLRPHLEASKPWLTLKLACNVANEETGALVVRPFLKASRPLLAGCSIRLSRHRNAALRTLAEDAVNAITEQPTSSEAPVPRPGSRSFLDLPTELRRQILSYTDLVVPDGKQVYWNPETGTSLRYGGCHDHYDDVAKCGDEDDESPSVCYCRISHAATSSTRCRCWAPGAIFLVSREVREDALYVYYRSNSFVVTALRQYWQPIAESPRRVHVATWLRDVVPRTALSYLRRVTFVFPSFGCEKPCTYCPLGSRERSDWIETVEWAKAELNLPKLTLSVHFAQFVPQGDPTGLYDYRSNMTVKETLAVERCYLNTIAPLKRWGMAGLGKLYIFLPDPRVCGYFYTPYPRHVNWFLLDLEQEAERLVMGKQYDAMAAGKQPYPDERWLRNMGMCTFPSWDTMAVPRESPVPRPYALE